jgi:hypothetical protein
MKRGRGRARRLFAVPLATLLGRMHEGLRHAEEEHERTREGDGRERQKGGAVAGMHDHDAGKCRRQRGADALRGQDRALRDIVAARSARAPTSAIGTITICAATMQADIKVVPRFLSCRASFWPTSGSIAALAR